MHETIESEQPSSRALPGPESRSRRLFVNRMAGLGTALASSSLSSTAASAQTQAHQPAPPGHEIPPVLDMWGPFTPSSGAGQYLQLVYPPSATAGELQ